ncbi:DoxX family protein [Paenibacillus lignilyticus]|uniref:DoxX family protein n=1 Tax=Paenibacillus lignilyticus TaxID=1172615 RepID=UPI001F0A8564|nr:DoxX family protein [Paenibacillus lignilyticus]
MKVFSIVEGFQHYGYPGWFRILTGIIEVISAILVIAGIWDVTLAAWGSLIIIVRMLGASLRICELLTA